MIKLPLSSKTLEFTAGKLRFIVCDNNLWNTVPCKLSFDFVDNCVGQGIIEFVDLKKVEIVVDNNYVVCGLQTELIYGNLLPWSRRNFVWL